MYQIPDLYTCSVWLSIV